MSRKKKRIKEIIVKVRPKDPIKLSDEEIDAKIFEMANDFLSELRPYLNNPLTASIINHIYNSLRIRKYGHSLGVAVEALKISRLINYPEYDAVIAGLLHDYCKEWGRKKCIEYIKSHDPGMESIAHTVGVHGYTASLVAKYDFGITDLEILSAIRYHTMPTPNMTLLDKIIYIADYLDQTRTLFDYDTDKNWNKLMLILRDWDDVDLQLKVTSAIHYQLEELKSSGDMDKYFRLLEVYDYQMNIYNTNY